jgi:hypothetical protein
MTGEGVRSRSWPRRGALLTVASSPVSRRCVILDVEEHLAERPEGLAVTLRRPKTDQDGAGRHVALPYGSETCPVTALRSWLDRAAITTGPLFRPVDRHRNVTATRLSDRAVALVVKRRAEAAGLDAAAYGGYSLRAGLATTAETTAHAGLSPS